MRRTVAGLLVGGLVLTGCSSFSDKSADEAVEAAVEEMRRVETVRMKGELLFENAPAAYNVVMDGDGECQGTVEMRGAEGETLTAEGQAYVRGDERFWTAMASGDAQKAAAAVRVVGERWATINVSADTMCPIAGILEAFQEEPEGADYTKGDEREVAGREALEIVVDKGTKDELTIWIATDGDHHIVKLELPAEEGGDIEFSDFNEDVDIEAPADGEYVDLSGEQRT